MIKITKAEFITSVASRDKFLKSDKPIIAVCGKSNVGKSSFINMLSGNGKLAKVSKDPGRTRLINYFDFGYFVLADLPGYGYAKVSKEEKAKWAKLLDAFFAEGGVSHVLALTDLRHDPTADDRQMIDFLVYNRIPFTIIATKADKLSRAEQKRNALNTAAAYACGVDNVIAVSSVTRQGLDGVLESLEKILTAGGEDA